MSMRISNPVSLLFLTAAAGLVRLDRPQLAALQTTQKQLAAEVAKLGSPPDAGENPTRSTKRKRASRAIAEKLSTAELIGLVKEMERLNTGGANCFVIGDADSYGFTGLRLR